MLMNVELVARLKTAIISIPVVLVILYMGGICLKLTALVVIILASVEYFSFSIPCRQQRKHQFMFCCLLPAIGYLAYSWPGFAGGLVLAALLMMALSVYLIEREEVLLSIDAILPAAILGLCYVGVLGTMLVAVTTKVDGRIALGWLFVVVVFSDSSAYFGGKAFGGRKLSTRVSPHKTFSGAITGLVGAVAGGLLAMWILGLEGPVWQYLLWSCLGGVLCQIGDLVESLIKRIFEVKDASTLFPGHGGMLDRIDGLIFAAPMLLLMSF